MEYINVNGTEYECQTITTGTDNITFTMEKQEITEIETTFRKVTELEVASEDKITYGTYKNLSFESATVSENGTVIVTMHIKSAEELRLETLEQTQTEQDEAIACLIYGGEV